MVNCYEHAICSVECVQKIAGALSTTPLQLNERQCQLVARELAEVGTFLENNSAYLKSDGASHNITLLQLASALKRAELLVKKCCCKDLESWLLAAMMLVEIQEEVATVILDIQLWRMVLEIEIASGRGLPREQKAEKLKQMEEKYHGRFKKLRREKNALQEADKGTILSRIVELNGSLNDLENLRAVFVQSLLTPSQVGTGNAASIVVKLNEYKDLHYLGKGGCGTVFEVTWLGVRCALKILNVQDEREATALKGLFHPNIVRLFHSWEAGPPRNPKSHMLMELMPTDLAEYIKGRLKNMPSSSSQTGKDIMPFSLPVAIDIMEQVAQAMQYMHDRHLSHRDLKPSNILVKERENVGLASIDGEGYLDIKLADFGLAKAYEHTSTVRAHTVNTGTPIYGAPEIFGKDLASVERKVLPMADVWSFGITCAEILSGMKPYDGVPTLPRPEFQRRIFREGLRPTLPTHCPDYLAFCISSCWELLPERRPSFGSICKLLRHAKLLSLEATDLDECKLFFAYTTRSGYVKCLSEVPKSSMGEWLLTFFYTLLSYLSTKHLFPKVQSLIGSPLDSTSLPAALPHEAESVISNSIASQNIEEPLSGSEEIVVVETQTPRSATFTTRTRNMSPHFYRKSTVDALREYTLKEIEEMTESFTQEIGRGGKGIVYLAKSLPEEPIARPMAVKRLPKGTDINLLQKGTNINRSQEVIEKEFWSELNTISRLHHGNLVALLGFCIEEDNLFLVYEYMANGSLEKHLHQILDRKGAVVLDWEARMRCAAEVAQGLEYLHSYANPMLVHRDIKSANILFDDDMHAKIANLGLSKSLWSDQQVTVSTRVRGTYGYVDPVYLINGVTCDKNDVYSYGVVLLELITGRRAIQQRVSLVTWCKDLLDIEEPVMRHFLPHMVDSRISPADVSYKQLFDVVKVAQMCVKDRQEHRPTMKDVVVWLHNANCKDYSSSDSSVDTLDLTFSNGPTFSPFQNTIGPRQSWLSSYNINDNTIRVNCTVGINQRISLRCKIWSPKNFQLNRIELTQNGQLLWNKSIWPFNAKSSREFTVDDDIKLIAEWHVTLRFSRDILTPNDPRRSQGPLCVEYLALKDEDGRPFIEYLGDMSPCLETSAPRRKSSHN